jgi:hypothetical protein
VKKPKPKKIFQPITRGRVRRAMKSIKAFNEFMAEIVGKENIIKVG